MATMAEQQILFVPGLGDQSYFNKAGAGFVKRCLEQHGAKVTIFAPRWCAEEPFQEKRERLTRQIDLLSTKGNISLVGHSAGGSLSANAFIEKLNTVTGLVVVAGRLKKEDNLDRAAKKVQHSSNQLFHLKIVKQIYLKKIEKES